MSAHQPSRVTRILVLFTAAIAAACTGQESHGTSQPGAAGTTGHTNSSLKPQLTRPIEHPSAAQDPLVCEQTDTGWGGRHYYSANLPQFVLYGDGLIVFGPPAAYSYEMRQARVNEDGIQYLLGKFDDLGLFANDIVFDSDVQDAASSRLRLVVGTFDRLHRVYPAGGYKDTAEGRALRDGYAALEIDTWPSGTFVEPPKDLEYSRVNLRVRRFLGPCDDAPAWPLASSPAIEVGGLACLDLDRETARPFTPVAPGGDNSISMRSGDACLAVMYRLVLPHEAACADGQPSACDF